MLKIGAKPTDPYWLHGDDIVPAALALPGVNVQLKPITIAMRLAAREAVREVYAGPDSALTRFEAEAAYTRALARIGIVAWQGVRNADGEELAVTPENVDLAMTNEAFFAFLERGYAMKAIETEAEKNVSAPSQNGTGGAKTQDKPIAAIAPRHAQTAPTDKTPRGRRKVRLPGRP